MNVLLVSPNREHSPYPIQPLGLLYVADALGKAGHEVDFCDCNFLHGDDALLSRLKAKPDLICFSLRNIDNTAFPGTKYYLPEFQRIVNLCRERCAAPLLIGGAGFSLMPEEILAFLDVDHGIVGQGERAIVEFLECLDGQRARDQVSGLCYRQDGVCHVNAPDFSVETIRNHRPARELLDMPRYQTEGGMANIQTKRGCPFQCIYCTYPVIEGRVPLLRDPFDVVDELAWMQDAHDVRYFSFVDSVFNVPLHHATAICEEILRRDLRIRWTSFFNPHSLNKGFIELAKCAGCSGVELGCDALDDAMLESLKKGFTVDHVEQATRWFMEVGINVCICLILGGPGENRRSIAETFRRLDKLHPTHAVAFGGVRIYPRTEMERIAKAEGYGTESWLMPQFYFSRNVEDALVKTIQHYGSTHPNFSFEGLQEEIPPAVMRRLHKMGFSGPVWESFSLLRRA